MDISITINCPDLVTAAKAVSEALCSRTNKGPVASVAPATVAPQPTAPVATPVTQSAPQMTPPVAPQPVVPPVAPPPVPPTAPAPTLTLAQICKAGADWMVLSPNNKPQLQALCQRYGVADPTQLKQEQLGAFATELRALGVQI